MIGGDGELLVAAVVLAALVLIPLASWLIGKVGDEVSTELDGGRTGANLGRHLDRKNAPAVGGEAAMRDAEIRQLVAARSYLRQKRGEPPLDVAAEVARVGAGSTGADDELRAEVRSMVRATNERRRRAGQPELDVEVEVERRLRDAGA